MISCPSCQVELENDAIFCSNCGIDVKTFIKAQKYNTSKLDKLSIQERTNLVLSPDTIELYQKLTDEVNNLQDIPQKLQISRNQYTFLQTLISRNTNQLNHLDEQVKKELKDVEKLKTMSMASLIAKVKGDKEKRLKKEEEEYLNVLNKKEALEQELATQKKELNNRNNEITQYQEAVKRLEENKAALLKIIHKTTMGVPDPVEDKIEAEMESLITEYQPLDRHLEMSTRIMNHLKTAYSNLTGALNQLRSASNYSDWDTFLGGGMFVDSIKHSKMSNARDLVASARRNLEMAKNIDPTISNIDAYVEDISFFWDGFMDNIFSDWSARNKIRNSLMSVENAVGQLNNTINKINYDITTNQNRLNDLNIKMADVQTRLVAERKRMIEDAIKRQ